MDSTIDRQPPTFVLRQRDYPTTSPKEKRYHNALRPEGRGTRFLQDRRSANDVVGQTKEFPAIRLFLDTALNPIGQEPLTENTSGGPFWESRSCGRAAIVAQLSTTKI